MPLSLGLYTKVVMMLISSSFCSMYGTAIAGGIRRQRPQHHQHLDAVYTTYGAFLSSASYKPAPPPPRRQQRHLPEGATPHRHCCDFTTTSRPKSWRNPATGTVQRATGRTQTQLLFARRNAQLGAAARVAAAKQPRRQARGFIGRNSLLSSGSLASSPRPPPPSPKATPTAPPSNVAVLARQGDSGDDLERCRRLAQKLGVELVVPRRESNTKQGNEREQEKRGGGAVGAAAEGETRAFKFTMHFDERGRLALDQPGSGFNPLVVRRSNKVPKYQQACSMRLFLCLF